MKILIAFATKTGTTEKCADMLIRKLSSLGEITEVNICKEKKCDITPYDLVVIGAPIRMGTLHKAAKKFFEKNAGQLTEKKTAYFICCGFAEKTDEMLAQNIPAELLKSAVASAGFGGELDMNAQKGLDKLVVKSIAGDASFVPPQILTENIDSFAEKIKKSFI